jgi:hypothetical protein
MSDALMSAIFNVGADLISSNHSLGAQADRIGHSAETREYRIGDTLGAQAGRIDHAAEHRQHRIFQRRSALKFYD